MGTEDLNELLEQGKTLFNQGNTAEARKIFQNLKQTCKARGIAPIAALYYLGKCDCREKLNKEKHSIQSKQTSGNKQSTEPKILIYRIAIFCLIGSAICYLNGYVFFDKVLTMILSLCVSCLFFYDKLLASWREMLESWGFGSKRTKNNR